MSDAPLRILHIVHSMGFGGMESRIARLARGLPSATHRVEVVSFKPAQGGQVDLGPDVPHRLYPIPSGLHPRLLWGLARLVKAGRYDIVHTHNWSSMFYGIAAARLAGVPLIMHGEHGLNRSDLEGIPWKRLWAQRLLARLAHWIVPVNGVIAAHARGAWKLDGSRMTVIPNGVDLARFAPAPPPSGGFTIGMVGRLDAVKDIGCALRALAVLMEKGRGDGIRLVLVGEGPARAELEAEAARLGVAGQVDYAGARPDVETWYGRFHLYLNTSVYEGMSNTLLEAMACGLPLVVSRVPGNADWLAEGGNALFFEAGDAAGLAEAIDRLRRDGDARAGLGKRNRARVEAEFDNARFIRTYIGLYARLTGGRGAPSPDGRGLGGPGREPAFPGVP
jgi:glycosyltransferase involved in cell wall biosynthesis